MRTGILSSKIGLTKRFEAAWKDPECDRIYEHLRGDMEIDRRYEDLEGKVRVSPALCSPVTAAVACQLGQGRATGTASHALLLAAEHSLGRDVGICACGGPLYIAACTDADILTRGRHAAEDTSALHASEQLPSAEGLCVWGLLLQFDLIQDNLKYFLELLQNKKSDFLEYMIVLLIAAEICVSLFDLWSREALSSSRH